MDIGMRQTWPMFHWASVEDITECVSYLLFTFLLNQLIAMIF